MKFNTSILEGRRIVLAGAPEGADARVLAEMARKTRRCLLHVARDDARLTRLAELIGFFAPDLPVLQFPAWDCLPYDRAGPHVDIVARRVATLSTLAAGGPPTPGIVLTTVSAALQRIPPRQQFADAAWSIRRGESLDRGRLETYLGQNGYHRAETVREPGEYALRGSIIDIFPTGSAEPARIDLFGDDVETIRAFDPMTQRSHDERDTLELQPVSEIVLGDATISRFRGGYRELAGQSVADDPLYEAVSAGRRHPGLEHWLPLFFENLETLFDFVPDATVTLDPRIDEARLGRLDLIGDYYEARRTHADVPEGDFRYRPVPPADMFLDDGNWRDALARRGVVAFAPFDEPDAQDLGGRPGRDFAPERTQKDVNVYDAARDHLTTLAAAGRRVMVAAYSAGSLDRLIHIFGEHGFAGFRVVENVAGLASLEKGTVGITVLGLERGFETEDLVVVTEQDILGDRMARAGRPRRRPEDFIRDTSTLEVGDLVVHAEHGIGRYEGLEAIEVAGAPHDCLRLVYDGGDKLFLPVENLEVLSRFGSEESGATLDRLGGAGWQARKARVRGRLRDMADELIRIAASRELNRVETLGVEEGAYSEFCSRFPFTETDDQQRAISETIEDLSRGRPMDRLVCGDVGFGKTEVALRAAFVAALNGQQVAVVVPTTLLARQHYENFRARFAGFPVKVAQLSRLVSARDAATVRTGLTDGSIDIIVGTHALLSKSIKFRDLGLLIVDEEQHFGVKQKERLKSLRANVHVLTLTATPIPRTLQLALAGVRDMSLIASPPVDRIAVRTFIMAFDPVIIREAILREQYRGGQTFYVCPRIEDLPKVRERLEELVPEAKTVALHGQMSTTELEKAMTAFHEGAYDILLCTNIIESGLDMPRVNTLIVHRADMFGLAQLYQIRGRVGRSKTRAYAYLTLPPGKLLTPTAERRLQVMQTLDTLGAGFSLASHDLDIRGAGNLLGEEQSGHIREVGIELYQQLLEEAVAEAREARGEAAADGEDGWSPQIALGMPVLIPEAYVADLGLRLNLYRRLAGLTTEAEIDAYAAELVDRFGPLPQEVENLLRVVKIKALCRYTGVERIEAGPKGAVISFHNDSFGNPAGLVGFINEAAGMVKLRPDHKLVYRRNWGGAEDRVRGVIHLMQKLADIAA